MSTLLRYLAIAVIAFFAGLVSASALESSSAVSMGNIATHFNAAHAQEQAY
jgi:hypothetical protein